MRRIIYITLLLLFTGSVLLFSKKKEDVQQKTDRMEQREKSNELKIHENPRYKNKPSHFIAEDSNYVSMSDRFVDEYTLPNKLYRIQKVYHYNGSLWRKRIYSLLTIISEEAYDEEGYLINRIKEEPKLKNIQIDGMDYISFFEKEGWFDRSTGQTAFREAPCPLNTGEFTQDLFEYINFWYNEDDPTMISVTIWGIKRIPQVFINKYGKTREDGTKYLERSKNKEPEGGALEVNYIIDIQTGTYKVKWDFIFYEE